VLVLGMTASARVRAALRIRREVAGLTAFQIKSASRHPPTCHLTARDSTERSERRRRKSRPSNAALASHRIWFKLFP
jgi:hypothetical protein